MLDRDGVINVYHGYVYRPDQLCSSLEFFAWLDSGPMNAAADGSSSAISPASAAAMNDIEAGAAQGSACRFSSHGAPTKGPRARRPTKTAADLGETLALLRSLFPPAMVGRSSKHTRGFSNQG